MSHIKRKKEGKRRKKSLLSILEHSQLYFFCQNQLQPRLKCTFPDFRRPVWGKILNPRLRCLCRLHPHNSFESTGTPNGIALSQIVIKSFALWIHKLERRCSGLFGVSGWVSTGAWTPETSAKSQSLIWWAAWCECWFREPLHFVGSVVEPKHTNNSLAFVFWSSLFFFRIGCKVV